MIRRKLLSLMALSPLVAFLKPVKTLASPVPCTVDCKDFFTFCDVKRITSWRYINGDIRKPLVSQVITDGTIRFRKPPKDMRIQSCLPEIWPGFKREQIDWIPSENGMIFRFKTRDVLHESQYS